LASFRLVVARDAEQCITDKQASSSSSASRRGVAQHLLIWSSFTGCTSTWSPFVDRKTAQLRIPYCHLPSPLSVQRSGITIRLG